MIRNRIERPLLRFWKKISKSKRNVDGKSLEGHREWLAKIESGQINEPSVYSNTNRL